MSDADNNHIPDAGNMVLSRQTPERARGLFEIRIESTCSGAWPVIVEHCSDPVTGEQWFDEIAQLPTAYVEISHSSRDKGRYGGYDEAPGRFKRAKGHDDVMANARLFRSAQELLEALQMAKHIVANEGNDEQIAQVFSAIEKATGRAA